MSAPTSARPDGDAVTASRGRPPGRPKPRRRAKLRLLGLSMAVVTAGFCAASGWTLYDLRQATYAQALNNESNLLNALSQDIGRNVEIYDLSLQAVVEGLREPGLSGLSPRLQDLVLYDRAASAKDLGAILVLDRDGVVLRGSKPDAIGADLSDREYFLAQKADPKRGLFISAPFRRRVTGSDEVIALSRAVTAADGSFAGVVVGTMKLAYFRDLFAKAELGPRGSINLLRTDGMSLIRAPYRSEQIGHNHAGTVSFEHMSASSAGSFTGRSSLDDVDRIYSYARVGDLPLILDVGLSERDVFAVWRVKSATIGLALAVFSGVAAALSLGLSRQFRRTGLAEEALSRSEAQYRLFADHAQDVIVRLDRSLRRTYVSPAVTGMLGYAPEELLGRTLGEIVHPEDWPRVTVLICASQAKGANTEATYRLLHRDGHHVWVEGRYSSVAEDGGFVIVVRDISARKHAEERLEALNLELARVARSDALTGLPNRRAFDEVLEREWRRAAREQVPVSLLFLDVDRFKAFNDRYGHPAGDGCLRAVAGAVEGTVRRPQDFVARYGGEELVIVLPGTDEAGAAQVAERVRNAVEALALPHLGNAACGSVVTASLGCSTMRPAAGDAGTASLIATADARLYEAKRLGRNRVCDADPVSPEAGQPPDEAGRLLAVAGCQGTIAAGGSESLDRIARLAAQLFDTPRAFVSLVGTQEAVLVGRHNVELESAPRDVAYCAHTILGEEPLVIPSTRADPRFSANALTEAGVGFYAGAPVLSPDGGHRLGALCIIDDRARPALDEGQRRILTGLARLVSDDLERRRTLDVPPKGQHMSPLVA